MNDFVFWFRAKEPWIMTKIDRLQEDKKVWSEKSLQLKPQKAKQILRPEYSKKNAKDLPWIRTKKDALLLPVASPKPHLVLFVSFFCSGKPVKFNLTQRGVISLLLSHFQFLLQLHSSKTEDGGCDWPIGCCYSLTGVLLILLKIILKIKSHQIPRTTALGFSTTQIQ